MAEGKHTFSPTFRLMKYAQSVHTKKQEVLCYLALTSQKIRFGCLYADEFPLKLTKKNTKILLSKPENEEKGRNQLKS